MRSAFLVTCAFAIAACSTSSAGTPATSNDAAATGFDCAALRDKQSAAGCPKFDPNQYMIDCAATLNETPIGCRPELDALASCILGQPLGCDDAGEISDQLPAACKTANDALEACGKADGG